MPENTKLYAIWSGAKVLLWIQLQIVLIQVMMYMHHKTQAIKSVCVWGDIVPDVSKNPCYLQSRHVIIDNRNLGNDKNKNKHDGLMPDFQIWMYLGVSWSDLCMRWLSVYINWSYICTVYIWHSFAVYTRRFIEMLSSDHFKKTKMCQDESWPWGMCAILSVSDWLNYYLRVKGKLTLKNWIQNTCSDDPEIRSQV